jgi:hypothetical protein
MLKHRKEVSRYQLLDRQWIWNTSREIENNSKLSHNLLVLGSKILMPLCLVIHKYTYIYIYTYRCTYNIIQYVQHLFIHSLVRIPCEASNKTELGGPQNSACQKVGYLEPYGVNRMASCVSCLLLLTFYINTDNSNQPVRKGNSITKNGLADPTLITHTLCVLGGGSLMAGKYWGESVNHDFPYQHICIYI